MIESIPMMRADEATRRIAAGEDAILVSLDKYKRLNCHVLISDQSSFETFCKSDNCGLCIKYFDPDFSFSNSVCGLYIKYFDPDFSFSNSVCGGCPLTIKLGTRKVGCSHPGHPWYHMAEGYNKSSIGKMAVNKDKIIMMLTDIARERNLI